MKKFLIFLISIIVVVCLGLTTYYFIQNREVIAYNTAEIYCNVGDTITIAELGKTVEKENKGTTYNYNAGGEEVVEHIEFNTDGNYYVAKKGGDVKIVISTSNKDYPKFEISVHIGDGSSEYPYFIRTQTELEKIGHGSFKQDDHYSLRNDIALQNFYEPICYNSADPLASGFGGSFAGNGHKISNITVSGDYEYAGLFSVLKEGSSVSELCLEDVNLSGNLTNAGALAGVSYGSVKRVFANNVIIKNTSNANVTGGLVGKLGEKSSALISSVKNVQITIGDQSNAVNSATVGGFAGVIDKVMVKACYVTGSITLDNATANVGGFASKLVVDTFDGSIQESYAIVNCEATSFAAFVDTIDKTATDKTNDSYLRHFIGNRVVTGTHNIINNYDTLFFKNFYDLDNKIYSIVSYTTEDEFKLDVDLIYYCLTNTSEPKYWDNCWLQTAALPELSMTMGDVSSVGVDYFLAHKGDPKHIKSTADFLKFINDCRVEDGKVLNKYFVLDSDVDLSTENWAPIAMVGSMLDGNGFTIKGLNVTTAENGNAGLFSSMDYSSVKNVVFEDVKLNVDATNFGVVAGQAKSSQDSTSSTIQNIKVTFANEDIDDKVTYFGGIVGAISNGTAVSNCEVNGLNFASTNKSSNVAGVVARVDYDNVSRCSVSDVKINNAKIVGTNYLAGAVALNKGNLSKVSGSVAITYAANDIEGKVGGLAAINEGSISNSTLTVQINIKTANSTITAGGVAALNQGTISSVTVDGTGIAIDSSVASQTIFMGGLAGINEANIDNSVCAMLDIGAINNDFAGRNFYVGGVSAKMEKSSSKATKCVASANLYGTHVSGVVVVMNSKEAKADQILVGRYDTSTHELKNVSLVGSKYVTGVVYDFSSGTISNVQAIADIKGYSNSTIGSIIALIFKTNAVLNNSTFDCSLSGYGKFYKETWTDYYNQDAAKYTKYQYNILVGSPEVGLMNSVVINTTKAKSNGIGYTTSFYDGLFDVEAERRCGFKDVDEAAFRNSASFTGSYELKAERKTLNIKIWDASYKRNLTFDLQNTWKAYNGIMLSFVYNLYFV